MKIKPIDRPYHRSRRMVEFSHQRLFLSRDMTTELTMQHFT